MPPGQSTGTPPQDFRDFVYQPYIESNPLNIPRELLDELAGDYGMVFQWTAFEVFGAEQRRNVTAKLQNHWSPVRCGDFDGRLAAWADCDNPTKSTVIEQGGLRLMCRPRCIQEMALQHQRRAAEAPVQSREQLVKGGVDVTGGSELAALRKNRISRSFERVLVPRDNEGDDRGED